MNATSPGQLSTGQGSLADVLERVLDKGVVIAGDIVVSVLDVELLSLKLRLFVASAQTAREMGMDWWTRDPFYSASASASAPVAAPAAAAAVGASVTHDQSALLAQNEALRRQVAELEQAGLR